jgi:hypothetical protein
MRGNSPGKTHLKRPRAVIHAVLMTMLSVTTPALLWASETQVSESSPILQIEKKGSIINVYGERLLSTPDDRVFFGAEDAGYLFEPRLLDANDSRIQLILPFRPISGRYKLKIGKTESEPAVDLVLVVDDSRIVIDDQTKGTADAILTVRDCEEDAAGCVSELDADSSAFCGMSADFDPYLGSQAITVSNTQELHLDDYYTIEARVFLREYVRGGIIVDKYSGSGRGREYRLSVGKDGLLRGWFSIDGTLANSRAVYSDYPVPKNRWVHVASTNEDGLMRLFIDGQLAAEKQVSARPAQLGYQNVAIGGNNCCRGYYEVLNGLVDEVRISNETRYSASFKPPTKEFEPDARTLLLMHFSEAGKNEGLVGGDAQLSSFNTIRSCAVS